MAQGDVRTSWKYPEQWYKTNFTSLVNFSNKLIGNKYLKNIYQFQHQRYMDQQKIKFLNQIILIPVLHMLYLNFQLTLHLNLLKKKYDFPVLFSRSANVYGPHQLLYRIIPRTILYAKLNKKIILHGNGNSKRSFIHINDVVRGYDFILKKGSYGSVYHISPSEPLISIYNLVKKICKIIQYDFSSLVEFFK